jgi:hypothetical protein
MVSNAAHEPTELNDPSHQHHEHELQAAIEHEKNTASVWGTSVFGILPDALLNMPR